MIRAVAIAVAIVTLAFLAASPAPEAAGVPRVVAAIDQPWYNPARLANLTACPDGTPCAAPTRYHSFDITLTPERPLVPVFVSILAPAGLAVPPAPFSAAPDEWVSLRGAPNETIFVNTMGGAPTSSTVTLPVDISPIATTLAQGATQQWTITVVTFDPVTRTAFADPLFLTTTIDRIAPVASLSTTCASPGYLAWCLASVTATTTDTDTGSGVDPASRACRVDGAPVACAGLAVGDGTHTISYSARDRAGNVGAATASAKVDTTPPALTVASRLPAANADGWNAGEVTVVWACTDATSTVDAVPAASPVSGEGFNQAVSATCYDRAGNVASRLVDGISIDSTAPVVAAARTPPAPGSGWDNAPVAVSFTCADALSGPAAVPPSQILDTEGSAQSATGTCADRAGNSASATLSGISIDLTAPTVIGARSPAANAAGWTNADVTVTWTCEDALSGVALAPGPTTVSAEGADQIATATCADAAGNAALGEVGGISIDRTAPALSATVDGLAGGAGWYRSDVSIALLGTDAGSGLENVAYQVGNGGFVVDDAVTLTVDGIHGLTFTATDRAGNIAAPSTLTVARDATAPLLSAIADAAVEATAASGATYAFALPSVVDTGSGPGTVACSSSPGATFPLGATTVTCTASDLAGNGPATSTFTVLVADTTAPTIGAASDVAARATGAAGAPVAYAPPATADLVDGPGVATCAPASGTTFALGETIVTCGATDARGNAATPVTFAVRVTDPDPPAFALETSCVSAGEDGWCLGPVTYAFTPSDAASGVASVSCRLAGLEIPCAGTLEASGAHRLVASATDAAGNLAEDELTLRIDTVTPAATCAFAGEQGAAAFGGPVQVTVSTLAGPSGLAGVLVALDGGAPAAYTGPLAVDAEGAHVLTAQLVNGAGVAATSECGFRIDRTAPESLLDVSEIVINPGSSSPTALLRPKLAPGVPAQSSIEAVVDLAPIADPAAIAVPLNGVHSAKHRGVGPGGVRGPESIVHAIPGGLALPSAVWPGSVTTTWTTPPGATPHALHLLRAGAASTRLPLEAAATSATFDVAKGETIDVVLLYDASRTIVVRFARFTVLSPPTLALDAPPAAASEDVPLTVTLTFGGDGSLLTLQGVVLDSLGNPVAEFTPVPGETVAPVPGSGEWTFEVKAFHEGRELARAATTRLVVADAPVLTLTADPAEALGGPVPGPVVLTAAASDSAGPRDVAFSCRTACPAALPVGTNVITLEAPGIWNLTIRATGPSGLVTERNVTLLLTGPLKLDENGNPLGAPTPSVGALAAAGLGALAAALRRRRA